MMIVVQLSYFITIVLIRPNADTKNNIIEITNEMYFIVLICFLTYYNSSEVWTDGIETTYMYIIMSNSATVILIMIVSFTIIGIIKLSKLWNKSKVDDKTQSTKQKEINSNSLVNTPHNLNYSSQLRSNDANELSEVNFNVLRPTPPDHKINVQFERQHIESNDASMFKRNEASKPLHTQSKTEHYWSNYHNIRSYGAKQNIYKNNS